MPARTATPLDLRRVSALLAEALRDPAGIMASALPAPLAAGAIARSLPAGKPVTSPVRSYEEHVARALLAEGFRELATSMLFTKELAERVEERAFAPAVVR